MNISKREIVIVLILVCIGCVRFFFFTPVKPLYESVVGNEVVLSGMVSDTPDVRLNNQRIIVEIQDTDSKILVVLPKDEDVRYGDMVSVKGMLETPENFMTTSGKEFDYEQYLARQGIYFIIRNPEIQIISRDNGSKIKSYLYSFRIRFMKNIGKVISSPESDLADGLILGARGGFDSDMRDEFIATGTIHIIALSGYNVTIVAEAVMKLLRLVLAQTVSIVCGIVVVVLFILMAGASATSVRAGIMAVIALLGRMTGRSYEAGRALIIAGLLMITYDPRTIFDISFQLSFLATIGVLFVTPKVLKYVQFIPMKFGLREVVATTIAATITVLPTLLYSTGILSLVSLPANILILPLIPLTMLVSFTVGITSFVSVSISSVFAYIAHLFLSCILSVVHFFATLPFASVVVKIFPLWIVMGLYILLFYWIHKKA